MSDIDRRTVLRAGLAGGLAAGAGALGGCDAADTRPGSAYGGGGAPAGTGATAQGGGSLILPGSPLVAAADQARLTTGRIRTQAIELTAGKVDLGGPVVQTWSYDGMVPGPVIRVTKGDIVRATFTSRIAQPTSVHWHGVALRNDMDGTLVTQHPIQPGASYTYQFKASEPGTYWYHPHIGTQQDRGLYGMLIVDDPAEPGAYDQEWLVVADDWIDGVNGYTSDKVLALLKQGMGGSGSMGSMGSKSSVLLSGATSPLLGGDAGDVRYPGYLINGRVPAAPHVFTGKPGQRVRIRILNAGGDTAFRVALGGHAMTVTHTDGHPLPAGPDAGAAAGHGRTLRRARHPQRRRVPAGGLRRGQERHSARGRAHRRRPGARTGGPARRAGRRAARLLPAAARSLSGPAGQAA